MKKKALVWILSSFATIAVCRGQCPSNKGQWEIAASYGTGTTDEVAEQLKTGDYSGSGGTKTLTYNSGTTFLSARYFLFNRLALGFSAGVQNEKGQYQDRSNPAFITSSYTQKVTTVAMELYYIYSFRKYLETYTYLGAGPAFNNSQTSSYAAPGFPKVTATSKTDKFKAQYTILGFRFGGRLGGFAELGYGYKGVLNGGISFRFGRPCWWRAH